ncbi:hypothetical protein ACRTAL_000274 [Clostridium perfringens]|uniref:hypothetical protein n=1 Tax=Clostridium perfringens TaxID=1502 RepID=UPI001A29CDAE|nr:hypothetical protein [Clostridium perfringens]MDU7574450.1 hypothetical protein [Clostridioides difficile]EHK2402848.1 hypothetical protein [Clostridium perfringens]MCH1962589.1 hypothetical protein [Clostridium perfringens]MDH2470757.1 hypothetical protein [Clostridium perfringens]MDK0795189.1 hypothetical protein [Clostridium perfringens]
MDYITNVSALVGVITGTIGALTGIGSLVVSYQTRKDINKPKIKFNLTKIKGKEYLDDYNLYIENISNYNLYEFTIELEEAANIIRKEIKDSINLLKEPIPVFTIGQVYESYLFNATDCKDKIDYMTFNITYKLKEDGKTKHEKYTINIKALRNVYMQIK